MPTDLLFSKISFAFYKNGSPLRPILMGYLFLACPDPCLSHFHIRRVSLMLFAALNLVGKVLLV